MSVGRRGNAAARRVQDPVGMLVVIRGGRPHRGDRSCGPRAKEKEEPMHKTNALSELQGELELLESETFEVLDLVEAREEMLGSTTSTTSCCSSCSSSSCSSTSCAGG